MAQQATNRDAVAVEWRRRQLPAAQIGLGRRVEVNSSLLHEPHHAPGRNRLGDGSHVKDRVSGDRKPASRVGLTISVAPDHLPVPN